MAGKERLNKALMGLLTGKANVKHTHAAADVTSGTLPIARGGTGAATASAAQANIVGLTIGSANTDNISVPAGEAVGPEVNIAKAGYVPIAIAGFNFFNASSGGTMVSYVAVYSCYISGNSAVFKIRNTNTTRDAKVQVTMSVLYRKA